MYFQFQIDWSGKAQVRKIHKAELVIQGNDHLQSTSYVQKYHQALLNTEI